MPDDAHSDDPADGDDSPKGFDPVRFSMRTLMLAMVAAAGVFALIPPEWTAVFLFALAVLGFQALALLLLTRLYPLPEPPDE